MTFMSQMVRRERFQLLCTSLLKMHDFPLFPGGGNQVSSHILNSSKFWKRQKADELLNMIFENSLPKGNFW